MNSSSFAHRIDVFIQDDFAHLADHLSSMRNSRTRSIRVATAVFLCKMRHGLSNRLLATLFFLKSKRSVSRVIHQVRQALMKNFVNRYLGLQHMDRSTVIDKHTTAVAKELLTHTDDQVCLVMDGTYLYIQKSSYHAFQRRTFSMHKHRNLVKAMIICTTVRIIFPGVSHTIFQDGYILSALGPFLANNNNNDASIAKHILWKNEDGILHWLKDDDIIVLDRGFRDAIATMRTLGLQTEMPDFRTNKQQFTSDQANHSRCVTKVRWVVESGRFSDQVEVATSVSFVVACLSANGKIKQWRFFNQTIQNSNIPFVGDYLSIVCSLINCYRASAIKDIHSGTTMTQEMINLLHSKNIVQERLRLLEASKELRWKKYDAQYCLFPCLTAAYVQQITKGESVISGHVLTSAISGSYQIYQAKQYIREHLKPSILDENDFEFQVQLSTAHPELVRVCFQSRHSNAKCYQATIQFDD